MKKTKQPTMLYTKIKARRKQICGLFSRFLRGDEEILERRGKRRKKAILEVKGDGRACGRKDGF